MKNRFLTISVFLTLCLHLLSFAGPEDAAAAELKISGRHPIDIAQKPTCTQCHDNSTEVEQKPIASFNHDSNWVAIHRFFAPKTGLLCNECHKVSFCNECHAYKEDLKPSDKEAESPERWLPHRGDYIFQHRRDGRIDPTSCFRCHGRQNNHICRKCHK